MLIDRHHIAKMQVTIITSFYDVSTPFTPTFFVHVLPFKWLDKELTSMFHNFLAFFNVILPFYIASIVFSSGSFVPFLLPFTVGIL
jgi:hypothetical protein